MTSKIHCIKLKWRLVHPTLARLGMNDDGDEYTVFAGGKKTITNRKSIEMRDMATNDNFDPSAIYLNGDKLKKLFISEPTLVLDSGRRPHQV